MSDWARIEFSEIATISKKKFNPRNEGADEVCIELEHIEKETGRLLGHISSTEQLSIKNVFKVGDVLFGKLRPNLRKYIYCDFDGVCSSEVWVLNSKSRTNSRFLFYLIQQEKFIRSACITSGSKMPRADWNVVSGTLFPLPPLTEQKAIADIIQKWDTAIEKTEALIAAKEQQFKWLVRNLIADKQYKKDWQETTLGEIFKINTYTSKSPFIENEGQRWIVDMGSISRSGQLIVSKKTAYELDLLNTGDLVMPKDDIGGGNIIGKVAIIDKDNKYVCGDHVYQLIQNGKHCSFFLRFLINSSPINKRLRAKANGTAQLGLGKKSVVKQEIWIPKLSEQKRIAKTLNTAQREIDVLKKLNKEYKTQKRGLMQKLLTGEWRVKNMRTQNG